MLLLCKAGDRGAAPWALGRAVTLSSDFGASEDVKHT